MLSICVILNPPLVFSLRCCECILWYGRMYEAFFPMRWRDSLHWTAGSQCWCLQPSVLKNSTIIICKTTTQNSIWLFLCLLWTCVGIFFFCGWGGSGRFMCKHKQVSMYIWVLVYKFKQTRRTLAFFTIIYILFVQFVVLFLTFSFCDTK